jgi:LysM repeat protein
MPARILRWTLCLVLVVGAAACGGGDDGGASEGSESPSSAAAGPSEAATGADDAAASETAGDSSDDGGGGTYTVRSGDTLSSIAQERGTTVEAIVEANDIEDPDVIDIGQELTIPSG